MDRPHRSNEVTTKYSEQPEAVLRQRSKTSTITSKLCCGCSILHIIGERPDRRCAADLRQPGQFDFADACWAEEDAASDRRFVSLRPDRAQPTASPTVLGGSVLPFFHYLSFDIELHHAAQGFVELAGYGVATGP